MRRTVLSCLVLYHEISGVQEECMRADRGAWRSSPLASQSAAPLRIVMCECREHGVDGPLTELILNRHDALHNIEAVEAQISDELGVQRELARLISVAQ